jgi:hypothetical protein
VGGNSHIPVALPHTLYTIMRGHQNQSQSDGEEKNTHTKAEWHMRLRSHGLYFTDRVIISSSSSSSSSPPPPPPPSSSSSSSRNRRVYAMLSYSSPPNKWSRCVNTANVDCKYAAIFRTQGFTLYQVSYLQVNLHSLSTKSPYGGEILFCIMTYNFLLYFRRLVSENFTVLVCLVF